MPSTPEFRPGEVPNIIRDLSLNELDELEYIAKNKGVFTGSLISSGKYLKHYLITRKWSGPGALLGLSKCTINWRGRAVLEFNRHGWEDMGK